MTSEYTQVQNSIRGLAKKLRDDARLMRDLNDNDRLEGVYPSRLRSIRRAADVGGMVMLVAPFKLAGHIGRKNKNRA